MLSLHLCLGLPREFFPSKIVCKELKTEPDKNLLGFKFNAGY
jgi:hypothetical protein